MHRGIRAVVAAAALLGIPIGAAAQPPLPTRWDTGASFGIMVGAPSRAGCSRTRSSRST